MEISKLITMLLHHNQRMHPLGTIERNGKEEEENGRKRISMLSCESTTPCLHIHHRQLNCFISHRLNLQDDKGKGKEKEKEVSSASKQNAEEAFLHLAPQFLSADAELKRLFGAKTV